MVKMTREECIAMLNPTILSHVSSAALKMKEILKVLFKTRNF